MEAESVLLSGVESCMYSDSPFPELSESGFSSYRLGVEMNGRRLEDADGTCLADVEQRAES